MLNRWRQEDGREFLTITSLGYKFQASLSYRERHCLTKRRKKGKNLRNSPPDVRACSFNKQTLTAAHLFLPPSLPPSPFQFLLLLFMFFWHEVLLCSPGFPDIWCVSQTGLELAAILLPQPPEYGDYGYAPASLDSSFPKVQNTTFIDILKYFLIQETCLGGKGCFHNHKDLSLDPRELGMVLYVVCGPSTAEGRDKRMTPDQGETLSQRTKAESNRGEHLIVPLCPLCASIHRCRHTHLCI